MPRWFVDSIEVNGGFLAGLSLEFPRGLTCIIGPRGSGKTTMAEALRYCLAGTGGLSAAGQKLMGSNLASSVVTVRTAPDGDGLGYVVTRSGRNTANLAASDGTVVASVDLDRRTFLPLDGYSSLEIEDIADETEGDKRRSLLDELRWDEIQDINYRVAEHRRTLDANADTARRTRELITDLTERIEEIGDARARLAGLPKPAEEEGTKGLVQASEQYRSNEQECQNLQACLGNLSELQTTALDLAARIRTRLSKTLCVGASANKEYLQRAEKAVSDAAAESEGLLAGVVSRLKAAEASIRTVSGELAQIHEVQKSVLVQLQERNAAAGQAIQERTAAEQAVANLNSLESERDNARKSLAEALQQRKELRSRYILEREQISQIREEVAQHLQEEIGDHIRIQVRRAADNVRYQQFLSEGLKGARVRNHEDILGGLMRLRPEQLAQIVQDRDYDEFEHHLSLGEERSRKILDAFRENMDPFELELVAIEDRVMIELNVGTLDEPNFKDAAGLSRGQKCTSLLPLLLARRDIPLVVDQPEDNLDNRFIFETVVEAVHRLKEHRQMIFITHNANIPVLAEADLVVVLTSDGKAGFVHKAGSLDDCRKEIIELLEGGEEAFELRRERYARP